MVMGFTSRVLHVAFAAATAGVAVWYSQLAGRGTPAMTIYLFVAAIVGFVTLWWTVQGRLGVMITFGAAHGLIGLTSPSNFGLLMLGTAVLSIGAAIVTSRLTQDSPGGGLTTGQIFGVSTFIGLGIVALLFLTATV